MGSLIGSVAQGYMGYRSTQNTNAANVSIARATNEMNRRIAESNNQTSIGIARENLAAQEAENEKTRQFNSIEAEKAFEREKAKMAYQQSLNSPLEAVRQLREAGLNPALAFGDIATVQGQTAPQASSSGSLSPSMPVLSSPNMIAPHLSPYLPQFSTGIFDSMLKIKQMKLLDSQSGNYDAQSKAILDKLGEEVRGLQLTNEAQEDINKLRRLFEPLERQMKLDLDWEQMNLLSEQAYSEAQHGDLIQAQTTMTKAMEDMYSALAKVHGKEFEQLKFIVDNQRDLWKANLYRIYSEGRRNNSEAHKFDVESWEADQKNKILGLLKDHDPVEFANTVMRNIHETMLKNTALENDNELYDAIKDYLEASAKNEAVLNDPSKWQYYVNKVASALGGLVNAGVTGAVAASRIARMKPNH